MSTPRILNRWFVVFGAVLIQLSLGAIYAWSVFTPTLKAEGWSKLDTQIVFAVGLATFAIVMIWAGRQMKVWGPKRLVAIGGLVLGAGYILAGLGGGTDFWAVTLGIGLIGGAGIGLSYVVPIAVGVRWFPDCKGMIIGLAVAGFGFGAMGWVKMAGTWGHLIAELGIANTFILYGFLFAAMVLIGSLWMVMPPDGWMPKGYKAPDPSKGGGLRDIQVAEMLHTHQFYMIFFTFAVSSGAGLMSIGLMKLYPMEALQANGLSIAEANAISGTAMAVFFSLANGLGRIAWGTLSDRLGRRLSGIILTATQGAILILFSSMAGQEYLLYLGATLIGFNYGGSFALFPALTSDIFGTKNVGQNYPYVFLSYGVGGIVFPVLGGLLGDLGNFPLAFTICGGACLLGSICISMIKPLPGGAQQAPDMALKA